MCKRIWKQKVHGLTQCGHLINNNSLTELPTVGSQRTPVLPSLHPGLYEEFRKAVALPQPPMPFES